MADVIDEDVNGATCDAIDDTCDATDDATCDATDID